MPATTSPKTGHLLKRLQRIEELPLADQCAVLKLVDTMLDTGAAPSQHAPSVKRAERGSPWGRGPDFHRKFLQQQGSSRSPCPVDGDVACPHHRPFRSFDQTHKPTPPPTTSDAARVPNTFHIEYRSLGDAPINTKLAYTGRTKRNPSNMDPRAQRRKG